MKLIGLTGGIGTGKTSVAEILRKRGWIVYDSDSIAKEVMAVDVDVRQELNHAFGPDILVPQGVDPKRLASLVFGGSEIHHKNLITLNRIVHPRVIDRLLAAIEHERASGSPLVAIETALLYEIDLEDGFDWVVVVDAPEDVCVERVMKRSHATTDEVRRRMAEQMSMAEKRGLADFVVDNATTFEALESAVSFVAMIIEAFPDPDDAQVEEEAP